MASVSIYLRMDKINPSGKVPIYLRVTKNRKSKYIALDVYIRPEDWNEKTRKIKSTAQNASQINTFIAAKVAEVSMEQFILQRILLYEGVLNWRKETILFH